jgi:hypothetical protein
LLDNYLIDERGDRERERERKKIKTNENLPKKKEGIKKANRIDAKEGGRGR